MQISLPRIRMALAAAGYTVVHVTNVAAMPKVMVDLAVGLGTLISGRPGGPMLDSLKMLDRHDAKPSSLSRLNGLDAQPWHVDGAHWPVPPRFLVLGCESTTGTGVPTTQLLRMRDVDLLSASHAHREPFMVRNGRRSFYSTISSRDRAWARFDPGCMTPLTDQGRYLAAALQLADARPSLDFAWGDGDILVIDNWTMFHRRSAPAGTGQRVLSRISVMEE